MYSQGQILVGKNESVSANIPLSLACRHGLITGATGTGKTVTLKVLAESFAAAGVPAFVVDVKGDLAGTVNPGSSDSVGSRVASLGLTDFVYTGFPVVFADPYGQHGHPVRTTVQSLGYRLLAKMLDLSEAQTSVLSLVYKIAANEHKKLNDLGDLESMLVFISQHRADYTAQYGNLAPQTLTTLQRQVLALHDELGDHFFGTPEFRISDLRALDADTGFGRLTILDAQKLFQSPTAYVALVLWFLNSLYDQLPEVGEPAKPKLVFFFDEAHLLFTHMPKTVIDHVIKIVKLIRSKGVGLYFISQSPADIPPAVLNQLGHKIQHALRAYTPAEQKAIAAAAAGLRPNPAFNTQQAIQDLATGEALVSFLDERGQPNIAQKVTILPPQSQMGPISDQRRAQIIAASPLFGLYETATNETSAQELNQAALDQLQEQKLAAAQAKQAAADQKARAQAERAAQKARQANPVYKLGRKVVTKAVDKAINKTLNSLMKNLFK